MRFLLYYLSFALLSAFSLALQAAPSDDFGRLFSVPSERNTLDILRQNQKLKVITPQELAQPTISAAPAELPDPITLQGYVKRSDGKSTLWVNKQAVQENTTLDQVNIGKLNTKTGKNAEENLTVAIPANGKHIRLKAGQMYVPESDKIHELKTVEKAKRLSLEEAGVINDGQAE